MRIRIKGISRKMKNKIKEHGDIWNLKTILGDYRMIETLKPVHNEGKYPYGIWAKLGEDIEVLEEIKFDEIPELKDDAKRY